MNRVANQIYGSVNEPKVFLVSIIDLDNGQRFWVGTSTYYYNNYHTITKLSSLALTVSTNNIGTLAATGGSGFYRFSILGLI